MNTALDNVGPNGSHNRGTTPVDEVGHAASLLRQWLIDYDHNRFGDEAPHRSFVLAYDALARLETAAKAGR